MRRKKIFLTIDDAPSADFIGKLNFLHSNNIPAIIFGIGREMEKRPEVMIDAIQKGYIIGNHSYSHPYFSNISLSEAKSEIEQTDQILNDLYKKAKTQRGAKLFRFPYGDKGWNKKTVARFDTFLPFRLSKTLNRFSGHYHKVKIQQCLAQLNYAHPSLENINYSFYHELNLMDEKDMYWTFDFCEYKTESIREIFSLMEASENQDIIHSKKYSIGTLTNHSSDDIVLIHDHTKTSHLFYQIIERCMAANFQFGTL